MIELVRTLDQHYHVCKSLSQVKQQILESLAWTGDSPLWEEIQANGGRFPLIQQVDTDRSDLTCFHLLVSNRMSGLCSSFQQSSVLESLVLYAGDATKFPWKSCTCRLRLSPTTRSSKSVAKTLGLFALCTEDWTLALFCQIESVWRRVFPPTTMKSTPQQWTRRRRTTSCISFLAWWASLSVYCFWKRVRFGAALLLFGRRFTPWQQHVWRIWAPN